VPSPLPAFSHHLTALAHTLDQPQVIEGVWKKIEPLGLAGMAALTAHDVLATKNPERKRDVFIQDALVLGASALGTRLAVKRWMMPELEAIALNPQHVAELAQHYGKPLTNLLTQAQAKTPAQFKHIIQTILTGPAQRTLQQRKADLLKALPLPQTESFVESLKDMSSFFGVGLTSVISGLAGGLVANKVTHAQQGSTEAMIKEGIFQFVANIALCAVGASGGLLAIEKLQLKNRLARTGVICGGLSVGILGGSRLANWVGKQWVNPMFNRLKGTVQSNTPNNSTGVTASDRAVGFSDVILHLDDLPTALALAGMEVIKPMIPLFFMFSGYRTGVAGRQPLGSTTNPAMASTTLSIGANGFSMVGSSPVAGRFGLESSRPAEPNTANPFQAFSPV
jgi:hypothetical protein